MSAYHVPTGEWGGRAAVPMTRPGRWALRFAVLCAVVAVALLSAACGSGSTSRTTLSLANHKALRDGDIRWSDALHAWDRRSQKYCKVTFHGAAIGHCIDQGYHHFRVHEMGLAYVDALETAQATVVGKCSTKLEATHRSVAAFIAAVDRVHEAITRWDKALIKAGTKRMLRAGAAMDAAAYDPHYSCGKVTRWLGPPPD